MFEDIFHMLAPLERSTEFFHSHPFEHNPALLPDVHHPAHLFDPLHRASGLVHPTHIEHHPPLHSGPTEGGLHGEHALHFIPHHIHIPHTHHAPATQPTTDSEQSSAAYQAQWDPAHFHGIGYPIEYSHDWQRQAGEKACAVVAQGEVFESLTGHHLTEQQLSRIAQENHLYDPEIGTHPQNLGKLLALLGVPAEQHPHATFTDLVNALQHNDRVIVGLNANEIWHPRRDSATGDPVQLPYAGHAVWVTGIEQEADGSVKVILCDSGTDHGAIEAVDAKDFLNAWADADNEMVVAHQSA